MRTVKFTTPEIGAPIVWCAVERNNGHTTAGLAEWSEELEAQLLDADLDSFWTEAPFPFAARLHGAIRSTRDQLTESEINVHTLEERLNKLEALKEELEDGLFSGSDAATGVE